MKPSGNLIQQHQHQGGQILSKISDPAYLSESNGTLASSYFEEGDKTSATYMLVNDNEQRQPVQYMHTDEAAAAAAAYNYGTNVKVQKMNMPQPQLSNASYYPNQQFNQSNAGTYGFQQGNNTAYLSSQCQPQTFKNVNCASNSYNDFLTDDSKGSLLQQLLLD